MLDDLDLFISIVETGSLAAGGEKLGLPPATTSRRLQQLEHELGYRLLNRSARKLQLTPEGQQYYEQCSPLIQGLRQATQRLDGLLSTVAGRVRVLAPVNLANKPLAGAWSSFLEKYPEVDLDLELSNRMEDLAGSGADLAIRVGELSDSSLTQRLLGVSRLVLVASPEYLRRHGVPRDCQQLAEHRCIVAGPLRQWRLHTPQGEDVVFHPTARVRVSDIGLAVTLAKNGDGILLCPQVQCGDELQSGELEAILPDHGTQQRHIYAVWSQQRYLPARVRALVEHLADYLSACPL